MKHRLLGLWGTRLFRLHVYAAVIVTSLTAPTAYYVAKSLHAPNITKADYIVLRTVQDLKSTALFVADE